MANEPMELAKNWDEKHASKVLPGYAQIKYDGVPLTFKRPADGGPVVALTRQNETALSVPHLLAIAELILLTPNASYTAECLIPGLSFKDSSGIIRRQYADYESAAVIAIVFDFNVMALPRETYHIRKNQFEEVYEAVKAERKVSGKPMPVHMVQSVKVETIEQVHAVVAQYEARIPNLEGVMIHSMTKPFQPGKRCWGMSRVKPQPTIDLEVVGFEEATSEAGEPLGMLGRVNVRLNRKWPLTAAPPAGWTLVGRDIYSKVVGVGPGKLTHAERKEWWDNQPDVFDGAFPVYAEIKYMPDPSYEALRQPTIQRLRTDKTEGDILEYV